MKSIIWGLGAVVLGFVAMWIYHSIKAVKDPDVQASADLRIDIRKYRKYKYWYDEHQRLTREYGIESKEANDYFKSFFKEIKNPNEWRRYQQSRYKSISELMEGRK